VTTPLISVILPAYNAEKTIHETISSILFQSLDDFELIIIDDGSKDSTSEIIFNINDKRIKYFYQENKERAIARNIGISQSQGKFIAFIDSDDLWHQKKLEKQIAAFHENSSLGLIYSDLLYFDDQTGENKFKFSTLIKLHRGDNCLIPLLRNNYIQSPTPLVRKDIFTALGGFDNNLIPVEDWDMWIRITNQYLIDFVDEPLAYYRAHQEFTSWSSQPDLLYDKTLKLFQKTEFSIANNSPNIKRIVNESKAMANYNYGTSMMVRNQYNKSLNGFRLAIKLNPYKVKSYFRLLELVIKMVRNKR
jgi:glycosyltransferase involved in cell wall biosynthesis